MRFAFFIVLFFSLAVLQTSFLTHFPIFGFTIPLVIVVVAAVALGDTLRGIEAAVAAGLVLDLFSSTFFGWWAFLLLCGVFVIHFLWKPYARIPILYKAR